MDSTRVSRVTAWLAANPGPHAPSVIARGLGEPTSAVASTLIKMSVRGQVGRERGGVNGRGSSLYYAATPTENGDKP